MSAEAYDRHTGRYGPELSTAFTRFAGIQPGMRVLDVGCGTGALTTRLAEIVGDGRVLAVDPSPAYAEACRSRVPGASVHVGSAEALPFDGGAFDAVLSQLVIQALNDPPAAVHEMRRVAARGGVVAACVWDFGGGMPLLDAYWAAARTLDPDGARDAGDDSANECCTREALLALWQGARIANAAQAELSAGARCDDFDDAWYSFAAGAGMSGAYCRSLDDDRRSALREEFRRVLAGPEGPFRLEARAWAVRGHA